MSDLDTSVFKPMTDGFFSHSSRYTHPVAITKKIAALKYANEICELTPLKLAPSEITQSVSKASPFTFTRHLRIRKIILLDQISFRNDQHSKISAPILLLAVTALLLVLKIGSSAYFDFIQQLVFVIGMLAIGIPHGAVDYLLEKGSLQSRLSFKFILNYLGLAFVNYLLWLFLPNVALLFFLVYSAWHFGETDMNEWQLRVKKPFKNLAWGFLTLVIILCGHVTETNLVLTNIAVMPIPLSQAEGKMFSWLFGAIVVLWALYEKSANMILSALMLFASIFLPLLTSFGLYFLGQHSFNGWSHLKQGMKTDGFRLYLKALPFTVAAVAFFLVMYLIHNHFLFAIKENWLAIFFVFISCISFPHVAAMNKFYKRYLP